MERLPYIDEHRTPVGASPERAWAALEQVAAPFLRGRPPQPFRALWHLEPASGFAVVDEQRPERLVLRGRHRFSRYELAFFVDPETSGTTLRARTSAVFPGVHGRAYRALVIGTRGHVVAVRLILRRIARAAERSEGAVD